MWCHCICINIMQCGQHHQWQHCISYVKIMNMRCIMTFRSCDITGTSIGMMSLLLSMIPLYSLGQADQNEVQNDFSAHVMPLASVLHYNNSTVNGTIAFLRSRWSKWDATWLFGPMMPLALALVSYDANSIINGTITFLRLRQLKWGAT